MHIYTTHIAAKEVTEPPGICLPLPFEARQKGRQRVRTASGEEIGIQLPRGITLRGGDVLVSETGQSVLVRAASEDVSTVRAASAEQLARVAYHLGNRHVWLHIGDGWVRYQQDPVLDSMVRQMGYEVAHETLAFEPEAGAYHSHAHGHRHDH